MRMFRLSDLAFWGVALCLSTGALAQAAPRPPPSVTVAKPIVKEIIEWDDFIGRFEAIDQVDVRARVSGYLDKVHFQDGAMVKAGRPPVHHRSSGPIRRRSNRRKRR